MRVAGAMAALEIVSDRDSRTAMGPLEVEQVAFAVRRNHGVIVRPYGNMLVVAPPLVFTREQVRRASLALIDTVAQLRVDGQLAAA